MACAMGDFSTLPNSVLANLMHPPPPLFPMNAISERKNDPLCNTFSSDSGIFRAHSRCTEGPTRTGQETSGRATRQWHPWLQNCEQ